MAEQDTTWPISPAHRDAVQCHDLRSYAKGALRRCTQGVASAPEGTRNEILNRAAFSLGRFLGAELLDRSEVEAALDDAAAHAGLQATEIERTVRSGLEAGALEPLVDALSERLRKKHFRAGCSTATGSAVSGEAKGRDDGDWPQSQELTHELPPVPPFRYDLLPDSLRPWIQDIAERIQSHWRCQACGSDWRWRLPESRTWACDWCRPPREDNLDGVPQREGSPPVDGELQGPAEATSWRCRQDEFFERGSSTDGGH